MSEAPSLFDPCAGESLSLLELPGESLRAPAGVRARCFELSCRGDRVPLELLGPEGGATAGTLLVQPVPHAHTPLARRPGLETWLAAGVAVASTTPPLFGSRRSPKLTAMLERAVDAAAGGDPIAPTHAVLWSEFLRQAVLELRRALDALREIGTPGPCLLVAGGLAASAGAILCAVDERVAGAVLASPVRQGPGSIEPGHALDGLARDRVHAIDTDDGALLEAAWPLLSPRLRAEPR